MDKLATYIPQSNTLFKRSIITNGTACTHFKIIFKQYITQINVCRHIRPTLTVNYYNMLVAYEYTKLLIKRNEIRKSFLQY